MITALAHGEVELLEQLTAEADRDTLFGLCMVAWGSIHMVAQAQKQSADSILEALGVAVAQEFG